MKIIKSKFIRNVAILATGSAGAQALTMLFSPIITRMYGAEQFGILGTFVAILGVLSPLATLAYPIAIVLPASDNEARGLVKLSFFVTCLVSFGALLIVLATGSHISELFELGRMSNYLIFVPVAMFFIGLQQILNQWLIRKKQFALTAKITIVQSIYINITKTVLGLFSPTGATLITLATIGHCVYFLQLLFGTNRHVSENERLTPALLSSVKIDGLAKKYSDFPLFRAPQQFLNALSQSLPVLMLAVFFGPVSAGFYTLSRTVLGIPSVLIGKAVGDVFYPRITTAANNKQDIFSLICKATIALAATGIIPFAIIVAFGPLLFGYVFGSEWAIAGEYSRWLAVWMYFMFMNSPCTQTIPVLGIQKAHLIFTCVTLIIRFFVLGLSYYYFENDIISVAMFSLASASTNIFIILYVLKSSLNYRERELDKND